MARLLASISLLVQVASGFSFSQSLLQQNHTTVPNHSFKVHIGFKENDAESSETNKPAWCRPGAAEELPSLHWLADDEYLASPFASCGASSDSAVHAPFIRRARIPERGGLSEANLEHGKQCITDLVPKVALLFLTQGAPQTTGQSQKDDTSSDQITTFCHLPLPEVVSTKESP